MQIGLKATKKMTPAFLLSPEVTSPTEKPPQEEPGMGIRKMT
jgi:hypothetical protein